MKPVVKAPALLACAALLLVAGVRAADEPKDVGIVFAKAVMEGDKKTLHEVSAGTAEQVKILDDLSDLVSSVIKFRKACDTKFGADNSLSKSLGPAMPDMVADVKKNEIKVDGDSAVMIDKDKPEDKDPLKFKKVDEKWKVDLSNLKDDATKGAPPGLAKNLKEMADDINADKYPKVEDAEKAFQAKMAGGAK